MSKRKLSSRAVYKSGKERKNKVCKKLCHVLVKWMPMKYAWVEEINGNAYSVTTTNIAMFSLCTDITHIQAHAQIHTNLIPYGICQAHET